MRQLFQDLRTGAIALESLPCPSPAPGRLVIQGTCSLISAGTERMLLDFGKSGWIGKIRSQPEKVRQVRQKIQRDGVLPTLRAVRRKLADPIPLGYSHVGRVLQVGPGVEGFSPGDLVLSNGSHAEVVSVPKHLCAKVPHGVKPEDAAFGVVGAIALQGLRLAEPTLGESVAVIGLGLIGQLAVQLLLAQGCRVLAIDLDPSKVALAKSFGAEGCVPSMGADPLAAAQAFNQGRGMDAVILTAASRSNLPLLQAAEMCRQRGRIVLVGVLPIQAPRDLFYKKELRFQVSCSYGPGRYDPAYEERGQDYPFGLVRWTEQRNIETVLGLMASGRIRCPELLSARFPFHEAGAAYQTLLGNPRALGLLLDYPSEVDHRRELVFTPAPPAPLANRVPGIAVIGAGQYAFSTLLPALDSAGAHRRIALISRQGASAGLAAKRFGFEKAASEVDVALGDPQVDAVLIATRHDSHAGLVVKALESGKHVFVEKPLATRLEDLERIQGAMRAHPALSLTVGFNRPWAPMAQRLGQALTTRSGPVHLLCEINAGALPPEHWAHGAEGGGRLIGEGCHFIHLLRHWVGHPITDHTTGWVHAHGGARTDGFTLSLGFADGSRGTILYSTLGHPSYPKEVYTAHWEGKMARLENFTRLKQWGVPGLSKRAWSQDKGHANLLRAWLHAIGHQTLQPPEELFEVSRIACLANAP